MPFFAKWFALFCLSFAFVNLSFALTDSTASQPLVYPPIFGKEKLPLVDIKQSELPAPFNFLLTQPLMTLGLEKYYQRNGQIKVIHAQKNAKKNTYSRAILMVMDNNKKRNDVSVAQARNETITVEFALITMNFNALPDPVIKAVLHSNTPFGKLLALHKIKTTTSNRAYFKLPCTAPLATLIRCKLNSSLYGRLNTLNHSGNGQWLAHVLEILPAIRCTQTTCQPA